MTTILILGIFVVIILIVYFLNNKRSDRNNQNKTNKTLDDFPPKPKWKPNLPVDIDLIYQTAKYYLDGKLQFAIFQNGTVTFFPKYVDNIEESAKASLDKIYNFHPDFNPKTMDDGNYIIEYSQPAFTIVFKDEIEKNWDYIEKNHLDGVCRAEVLTDGQGRHNVFDEIGKISLFGRAKMFLDAQTPVVVKIYNIT
ncbi:MAG: hypothetical protein HXX16_20625 [Bacteroidales bacterium]|nr:hypothetical protein [Bacteroidales bacterium]